MKLHQLDLVLKNYDRLTVDEQEKVPETSYNNAKGYLAITKSNAEETETK